MSRLPDSLSRLVHLPGNLLATPDQVRELLRQGEINNQLVGKMMANQLKGLGPRRELRDAEFRVYSQWGDDGIIQYLIHQVPQASESFVEFGVESYAEANTRFLLINDNWRGLILDGSQEQMERVRSSALYWQYDLTAVGAFVTRENINDLIAGAGFRGDLGILSIDIDGNDYWVWDAITVVDPAIVVVEYNAVFGAHRAVTVPYDKEFVRSRAHSSHLFWGCSVGALCMLAERKGYAFVGCNSNGNNAYFVKKALASNLLTKAPHEGYVASRFRDSRDAEGRLTYLAGSQRFELIADMKVHDVKRGALTRLGDVPDTQ